MRLKALVNKAIKERTYLPKAIVFVLDEDVIKQSNIPLVEAREGDYSTVVKYLMEQTCRLITSHASKLPAKSKQDWQPHIIWIVPPQHKYFNNNELCELFGQALETEAAEFNNICALCLKKIWDETHGNLYLRDQRCFTTDGYHDYWLAIDNALRFWDKTLREIMLKRQKKLDYKVTSSSTTGPAKQIYNFFDMNKFHSSRPKQRRFTWHNKNPEIEGCQKLPYPLKM